MSTNVLVERYLECKGGYVGEVRGFTIEMILLLLGAYFMAFNRARFILGMWLFIIVSLPALGQTGAGETGAVSRPWMLGISVQADDLDTDSRYATFNWHVTEKTWIYFSGGTSCLILM